MKNFGLLFALLAFVGFSFTNPNPSTVESYAVNVSESIINWNAYKVTGAHNGTIELKNGNLKFDNGQLVGGSFEMDMATIAVVDLKPGKGKEKLEGHLKSDDFFGVNNHPTSKFEITKVVPRGKPGEYKIIGNLTIKESTEEIRFIAKITEENGKKVAKSDKITIDRSQYNVRYGSGSFFENLGDKTIYDEFEIEVKLVTNAG